MSTVDGARSVIGASDETFEHVCEPCSYRGIQKEAAHVCHNCREMFCQSCMYSHKGQKMSRSHKVVPISELFKRRVDPKQTSTCSVLCDCNKTLEVAIYCEAHDDAMCLACSFIKHKACVVVSIEEKSASYAIGMLLVDRRVHKLSAEVDKIFNERKFDVQTLRSMKNSAKEDIKRFRQEIDQCLDLIEQNTLRALDLRCLQVQSAKRY